jgi:hypothetical protein
MECTLMTKPTLALAKAHIYVVCQSSTTIGCCEFMVDWWFYFFFIFCDCCCLVWWFNSSPITEVTQVCFSTAHCHLSGPTSIHFRQSNMQTCIAKWQRSLCPQLQHMPKVGIHCVLMRNAMTWKPDTRGAKNPHTGQRHRRNNKYDTNPTTPMVGITLGQ